MGVAIVVSGLTSGFDEDRGANLELQEGDYGPTCIQYCPCPCEHHTTHHSTQIQQTGVYSSCGI